MSLEISDLEKWVLSDLALRQLRNDLNNRGWDPALISVRHVIIQAPPSLLPPGTHQGEEIFRAFQHLTELGLLKPHDKISNDQCRFGITTDGIGIFRKYFLPFKIVKDKKRYNGLLDKIDGNPQIKKELKQLGDKVRDKLEDEIIEEFIKYALHMGSNALIYYVHLTPH